MNQNELNEVLKLHKLWLNSDGEEGKRADLSSADLRGADLRNADLRVADLTGVLLEGAFLVGTNFEGAHLSYANLDYTDLVDADLTSADLRGVNLRKANLRNANLHCALLFDANLGDSNLEGTGLRLFLGPRHDGIYNSQDDKLYIGCQIHKLDYWLKNYVAIGKKHEYTDKEIEAYGNWIKSLKEAPK